MANKVIHFRGSASAPADAISSEVYLDISTIAAPVTYSNYLESMLSDFYDYVAREKNARTLPNETSVSSKLTQLSKTSYDEHIQQYQQWKRCFMTTKKPSFEEFAKLLETEDQLSAVVTEESFQTENNIEIALLTDNSYQILYDAWLRYIRLPRFKLQKLVNVNAVKNSMHNIFSWTPGQRILNPEFGSNLRMLLYEGITDFNQERIIAEIQRLISQWEPRVQIDNVVRMTTVEDVEDNTVHLRINYRIPSLTDEQFYYDYDANAAR